eukprot:GFUD01036167.1.p1 GENE.GFUD01036167.1~~GFUD01036167.1.p1  ORF type:complete len:403 (+),score=139.82 GFUD01036167.1:215-1423(+)
MMNLLIDQMYQFYQGNPMLVVSTIVLMITYIYYTLYVVGRPTLHCRKNTALHSLVDSLPITHQEYRPTFWCWEPRLQSMVACFIRQTVPDIRYRREVFSFSDGGQVGLDWMRKEDTGAEQPIVLILPGITGSSQSEYVKILVNVACDEAKARCVVFNFRGQGGLELKSPRTFCAANSDDLSEILDHLKVTYPEAPVVAVGVSLGGIMLGNYLTDQGEAARSKLLAAMLISVCFDTFEGTKSMETPGLNLLLNRHLATNLVESIKEVKEQFQANNTWDLEQVFSSKTVREFDNRLTAKMFGYKSVAEYYGAARLHSKVEGIKVATLAVNAEDDPFQPGDSIPREGADRSSHLAILTTKYGGHVGFMDGWLPNGYFYSDRVFSQYIQAVFSNKDMVKQFVGGRL